MATAVVLFTRDLRVHDNPALFAAVEEAGSVVPLFVLDRAILSSRFNRPNRAAFLAGALAELDAALRDRGSALVIRRGDVGSETLQVAKEAGAASVHLAADVSRYAQRRQQRLHQALARAGLILRLHDDSLFVAPPGSITPAGRDHMAVFTPYLRRWLAHRHRPPLPAPHRVAGPRFDCPPPPEAVEICPGLVAPSLPSGGEGPARARWQGWLRDGLDGYAEHHDVLAADGTSRLSPYLHFGCISPVNLVADASAMGGRGADEFVRQVAWRDFHHQVLAARPDAVQRDYRHRGHRWRRSRSDFSAWQQGRTGIPIVDAAMRQLSAEGWMHNRARLIVGYFLCKELLIDWRWGAGHFFDLLVDGDLANNTMNWQWVAGTGNDTRFNRTMNIERQTRRFDPDGEYVSRYLGGA